jgi:VanZ family protein
MRVIGVTALYIALLGGIVYLAGHSRHHGVFDAITSIPGGDKCGHFVLMGLLSALLNASFGCRMVAVGAGRVLVGSLIACAAVTLEEASQIFLLYRTFDPVDLFFDYLGIWAFGRITLALWMRRA